MTHITLDQLSDYLNAGAKLDDVIAMIDMLKTYKDEIDDTIASWQELIPEVPADKTPYNPNESPYHWGDRARRKQLHSIVSFLRKQGYTMCFPQLADDNDGCVWEVLKGDKTLSLHWSTDTNHYFIAGDRHPRDIQDEPIALPDCLSWV